MATMNLWLVKKIPDRRSGDVVALLSNWVSPRLSESPPPLPPGSEFRKPADGRFCTDRRSREQQQQPPPSLLRKAMPTTMPMQVAADRFGWLRLSIDSSAPLKGLITYPQRWVVIVNNSWHANN